ncbi:MAG TPA: hypothetical protein VEI47_02590 [Gemmatimonadales bacterium]|nr:hypothetical protein [Gemmatimonadales bacterium]
MRAAIGLLISGFGLLARGASAQASAPYYHPLQLDCASFRQQVRSTIDLEGIRERSRETTGRDGILELRAAAQDSLIMLTAWFDTLIVWREGAGERLEPETDGVIGGRYKGSLTVQGAFVSLDRPFVPDEVAQVSDVGDALQELLPPLPPVALQPGQGWKDDLGTVISRLPDGLNGGHRVERYRLTRRSSGEEFRMLPDSIEVRATRRESETGVYEWTAELGVVHWDRGITTDVMVPTGGPVRAPFRTHIEQQATVDRVGAECGE